ncbi:2-succinyl-5-enolpyruvyl-6-hydroxy-3-cyclohexene- 1-carboxylic-acid synthase [Pseudonocardia eucalypti]|uniref:2-succinyl-5-enolpyruvyl-6-hydroxy-3-cyclohexene-1-carboxylate synthase n=1 Tax=Pseudonocardia eucalypti TaxID=648755 RepID=A0ABP9Q143_9PSEU|nr:2-succinyl-5-enolpyruvyl-6-hydroxy-3-cyclohexene-1-carboxylate synthase [Pseudonocardia eucalypti]
MNDSQALAEALVDELVGCGVTDAVLCPGSRNAPLSFALHRADRAGRLRLHVRIDERGAGFLALGLALGSGRAVPVACTSGTAAANLHPAVLEASYAGVPLLALTADRPPEMLGTGANQTIVQTGLYGPAPRLAHTLDAAEGPPAWRAWTSRAVAVAEGRAGDGRIGPVHLNLPFAEPLVPQTPRVGVPSTPSRRSEHTESAFAGMHTESAFAGVDADPLAMDPAAPTLVVGGSVPCGPVPGVETADGPPPPVVAEPNSPLWPAAMRTGAWLLGGPLPDGMRPRQVLLHGRPTLHRSVSRLLADPEVAVYAVAGTAGVTGPVAGELPDSVRAVGIPPPLRPPPEWSAGWWRADHSASIALDKALAEPAAPTGLRLAAALVGALPAGALLQLGSSNPVRDVSLAAVPRAGLTVRANRGVAGIDGTLSTSMGAALGHGGPGYALLGDLTALHDLTALVLGPDEPRPDLTLVVLNDGGGGIFSLLEQGAPEYASGFERVFGTPHRVRLDALCTAFGVTHHRIAPDLAQLVEACAPASGPRLIEVPAERADLRSGHAALRAAVNATLA